MRTADAVISLPQREIVRVRQYGRATLDRLKFAIDYGFTYARSNQQTQSTLHSNIEYRSGKVLTGGAIASLFASQSEAPTQIVMMPPHSTIAEFKDLDGTEDGSATFSQTIHRISRSASRVVSASCATCSQQIAILFSRRQELFTPTRDLPFRNRRRQLQQCGRSAWSSILNVSV